MNESKDIFMEMQDQYERSLSMMLQRYILREISFNDATKVYICPTIDCRPSSEYERNIIKHLKSYYQVNSNKKVAGYNKTCSIYHKHFLKKSNRDRHMKTVHQNDSHIADLDEKGQHLNDDEYLDEELPSMVYNVANQSQVSSMEIESEVSISFQHSESSIISPFPILEPSNFPATSCSSFLNDLPATLTGASSSDLPTEPPAVFIAASSSRLRSNLPAVLTASSFLSLLTHLSAALTPAPSSSLPTDQQPVSTVTLLASPLTKNLRLEHYLNKIITSFGYSAKVNNCVINYLKEKLKDNKKESVLKRILFRLPHFSI